MILKGFDELKRFLEKPRNIVVVGHRNPDGDAMGSTLALKHYLAKKGHNCTVVVPNEYPEFLNWLPGSENTYRFDWQNSQSKRVIDNSDLIFLLDFNALHRVGHDMQKILEAYPNDFAMIDHHQQPDDMKYMYSDVEICSTCQMVYQFIEMNNDLDFIDVDIATEGVVNYALSLKGIIFAAIFIEDKEQGIIKISFRSKGDFSVNKFSRNHFNGGGHDNAAGGKSEESMQETITNFTSLLSEYQSDLETAYED